MDPEHWLNEQGEQLAGINTDIILSIARLKAILSGSGASPTSVMVAPSIVASYAVSCLFLLWRTGESDHITLSEIATICKGHGPSDKKLLKTSAARDTTMSSSGPHFAPPVPIKFGRLTSFPATGSARFQCCRTHRLWQWQLHVS
jgi:hypothetical protein